MNDLHVKRAIESWFTERQIVDQVVRIEPLSGGCINEVFLVKTNTSCWVVKRNISLRYPEMLEKEDRALTYLARVLGDNIPRNHGFVYLENYTYLIMYFISSENRSDVNPQLLAQSISKMHAHTSESFGWEEDNYIGTLPQRNLKTDSFGLFFIEQRIRPLMKMAFRYWTNADQIQFESIANRIENLLPHQTPGLIHGDLWSGNLIWNENGKPFFIDPAIYFGVAEQDLSMMSLFGGIPETFFLEYENMNFQVKGWRERKNLYNLYPLLVHLNLFGSGYLRDVRMVLREYA